MKASEPAIALYEKGNSSLTDYHILSSIGTIPVELAKSILAKAESLNDLATWNIYDFMKFEGIGLNKATALVSAFELGRRRMYLNPGKKVKINCSKDAYDAFRPYLVDKDVEEFYCLYMNRSNFTIKIERISIGGHSGTIADSKVIFKKGLELKTNAMILAHNHPSGSIKPSEADIRLTKRLVEGGKYLETPVLDHIIFTNEVFYSFADEGMI